MSAVDQQGRVFQPNQQTYAEYIRSAIIETIRDVSDENLLNYIHTMLMSALTAEMQPADW